MAQSLASIKATVRELLQKTTNVSVQSVSDSYPLADIANFDSMAALFFMTAIEKRFKVAFDISTVDRVLYNINTVAEFLYSQQ